MQGGGQRFVNVYCFWYFVLHVVESFTALCIPPLLVRPSSPHPSHSQALAATHRELEDKSTQLSAALASLRWLEADRAALRIAADAARADADACKAALALERATGAERQREHAARADEAQRAHALARQLAEQRAADEKELQSLRAKVAELSASSSGQTALSSGGATPTHAQGESAAELRALLQSLSGQMLAKQSQLERALSAEATARLQWQQQITRADLLQRQVDILRADDDAVAALTLGLSDAADGGGAAMDDLEHGFGAAAAGSGSSSAGSSSASGSTSSGGSSSTGASVDAASAASSGLLRARWGVVRRHERTSATRTLESIRGLGAAPSLAATVSVMDSLGAQIGAQPTSLTWLFFPCHLPRHPSLFAPRRVIWSDLAFYPIY